MNKQQQHAILVIGLYAAFSDGVKDDRERAQIRRLAESYDDPAEPQDMQRIYHDVLLKRVNLADVVTVLSDPQLRHLAYEIAVCVCDADGQQTAAEKDFLSDLQGLLGLDSQQAQVLSRDADAITELSASVPTEQTLDLTKRIATVSSATGQEVFPVANMSESELNQFILKYSVINGALELLPQSWASLAIIPLQIKLVYRIGKAYGIELDQGHIKEFLATAGIGLTSQYLEQFGRKLLGGLLGKAAGGLAGKLGSTVTGAGFSFATTYALGQIAKRYYASGRQMNSVMLRESFQNLLEPAKELQTRYLSEIQQKSQGLDAASVLALVRRN